MTVRTLTGDRASIVTSYKLSMKTHSQKIHFELKCNIPFEGRCCTSIIKQTDQILNTVSTHAGTVSMKRQTPSAGNCPLTKYAASRKQQVWEGGTLWSGKGAQQGRLWSGKGAQQGRLWSVSYTHLTLPTKVNV